ncbi:MAG TPA: transposase, partial [Methanospirillum sp.]|nr:transposase [Methanospirillum sp.]
MSIAYYLILEDSAPLYRFDKWGTLHKHPYGKNISSQRASDIFSAITEEDKQKFFSLQGRRRCENEFWAYDTTTLSSYSETLKQVQ